MCKKLFLFASVILLVGTPALAVPAPFDNEIEIGTQGPGGVGYHGVGSTVVYGEGYLMTAGGDDIWGNADRGFHYAYKDMTGDFRVTTRFDPGWLAVRDGWAKYGLMIRVDTDADSINYYSCSNRKGDRVRLQHRFTKGGSTGDKNQNSSSQMWDLGIQRVSFGPLTYIQGLVDRGSGWELIKNQASMTVSGLPDAVMAGVAINSNRDDDPPGDLPHQLDKSALAQMAFRDVEYTADPELIGVEIVAIPEDAMSDDCREWDPGFRIRVMSAGPGTDLNGDDDEAGYVKAADLLADGILDGVPTDEYGARTDPVVNLHDTSNRHKFGNDMSFPGIDAIAGAPPTGDPHDGDDDEQFAIEVLACVELTAGAHVFGAHMDDGVKIDVGGVEIGRTSGWNNEDAFLFTVAVPGKYDFYALGFERGGGCDLEIYEMIADGSWILLGAVDEYGSPLGSPVYVPEPATIALLGFGGLTLLRIRRKR